MNSNAIRGGAWSLVLCLALWTNGARATQWPDLERPARSPSPEGSKDAAIVIAIEDYFAVPDIHGALSNGRAWHNWLVDTRKTPTVKTLFNEQATKEAMLQAVAQVASRVQPGGRLWVVYIGHGAPSEGTGDGLLIGVDAQQTPMSLAARGLPRGDLLAAAEASLPAGAQVVMVQDACFSGSTQSGDLAPGMAPLKVVKAGLGGSTTVLAAAKGNQYAGPLSDSSKPAFSYLVLGALRGWGDKNRDGLVSAAEAVAYAEDAMVVTINGRSQTPELEGRDVPLGRSAKEKAPDLAAIEHTAAPPPVPRTTVAAPPPTAGAGSEFAALAAQAAAAQAAREQAEAAARALTAQLDADRRARTARATAELQAAARRDFDAIAPLVNTPSKEAEAVLMAWYARYGHASVEIDGQRVPVVVAEAAKVEVALKKLGREIGHGASAQTESRESRRTAVTAVEHTDSAPKRGGSPKNTKPTATSPLGCSLPSTVTASSRSPLKLGDANGITFNLERHRDRGQFRSVLQSCSLGAALVDFEDFDREMNRYRSWGWIPFTSRPKLNRSLETYAKLIGTLEAAGYAAYWAGAPEEYAGSTLSSGLQLMLAEDSEGKKGSSVQRPPREGKAAEQKEGRSKKSTPDEEGQRVGFWKRVKGWLF
jgi:hypothetical protein